MIFELSVGDAIQLAQGQAKNIFQEFSSQEIIISQGAETNIIQLSLADAINIQQAIGGTFIFIILTSNTLTLEDSATTNQKFQSVVDNLQLDSGSLLALTSSCPTTTGITLTYPFISPEVSLILRKPDFGNLDTLEFSRINRESRGGTLIIFRDSIWPITERQSYQFSVLSHSDIVHLQEFFRVSLGKEIGLLDYENRQWRGIILNPDSDTAEQSRGSFIASFDFEGVLA
jgi:hypothetical protein